MYSKKSSTGNKAIDNAFDDLISYINKKEGILVGQATGTTRIFRLPYGWEIECTEESLTIKQYGIEKGLSL